MGLEGEVGVIAPGKLADIVIWNSDPLADITVLQRPSEIRPSSRTVGSSIVRRAASASCLTSYPVPMHRYRARPT
jgi:urease alpha subunit